MEFSGKTIENAIESGLKELNIDREDAIITIVDEGTKGVLGFGSKKARVIIENKNNGAQRAVSFLDGLFEMLKISAQAELDENSEKTSINILTTSSSSIIGYRGEMLDALQTLASAVANIGQKDYKRVVVDCENYREKREQTLVNLAKRLAEKAIKNGKKVFLEPMNPFERRIIHSAIVDIEGVKTESQGNEPNRFVVIIPDNIKPFEKKRGGKGFDKKQSGFKSDMIKFDKKTSGFGTFLGNNLKND